MLKMLLILFAGLNFIPSFYQFGAKNSFVDKANLESKQLKIENDSIFRLELYQLKGQRFKLRSLETNFASVFVFLLPDCPLSQNYSLTLNQLAKNYAKKNINFYGIFVGKNIPVQDIQHFIRKYKLSFPVYLDKDYQLADCLKATIAPEVFLVNNQGNTLYQGAIDNWAVSLGKKRLLISKHYLKDALEAIINQVPIKVTKTEAIGCFIHHL